MYDTVITAGTWGSKIQDARGGHVFWQRFWSIVFTLSANQLVDSCVHRHSLIYQYSSITHLELTITVLLLGFLVRHLLSQPASPNPKSNTTRMPTTSSTFNRFIFQIHWAKENDSMKRYEKLHETNPEKEKKARNILWNINQLPEECCQNIKYGNLASGLLSAESFLKKNIRRNDKIFLSFSINVLTRQTSSFARSHFKLTSLLVRMRNPEHVIS